MAIEHAMTILSWHENLPKEEIPPEHLWDDSEGLELWWNYVRDKREDEIPIPDADRDDDEGERRPGKGSGKDKKAPAVAENDLARIFRGR